MTMVETKQRLIPVLANPARPTLPFRVADTFLNKANDRVKIAGWGRNFEAWFGGLAETVEPPTPLDPCCFPPEGMTDEEIVEERGGKEAARMYMSGFWEWIALQGHGQPGLLPVNGYAVGGYAFDANGVLRTVDGDWDKDGWNFNANEFPNASRWDAGSCVLVPRNYWGSPSASRRRSFPFQALFPAVQHLADFFDFREQSGILGGRKKFLFPGDLQEKLHYIHSGVGLCKDW
jgi:hypothetical protein